jgi:preprotein translocase subunit SecG
MYAILLLVYIVICIALIISVLLQSAKGEGLAGAFGGGGISGAVFGGRGAASFLSRATSVLAVLFMAMAIVLSFMSPGSQGVPGGPSAVQQATQQPPATAPATEVPGTEPVTSPAAEELFEQPADTGGQ